MLGFPPVYLGHNLSCYLVYIWSRMFEGQDVDVMGLFHLQVRRGAGMVDICMDTYSIYV